MQPTDRPELPPTAPTVDVTQHMGLAHMACRPFRKMIGRGFDYDDLFQAACLGLMRAAETFDPTLGKFSTYAVPLAQKYVKALVANQARTVRVPRYVQDQAYRNEAPAPAVSAGEGRERRRNGRPFDWNSAPPPVLDVAVRRLPYQGEPTNWKRAATTAPGECHSILAEISTDSPGETRIVSRASGLNSYASDADPLFGTFGDLLASDEASPEDLAAARQIHLESGRLLRALESLNDQERTVIRGRLDGKTQPELAAEAGVTKQRIFQIQESAVRKLQEALSGDEQRPNHGAN